MLLEVAYIFICMLPKALAHSAGETINATGRSYIVCTIPVEPMVYCTPETNEPSTFTGLSIEIFRDVALKSHLWTEGVDYKFVCLEETTPTILREYIVPVDGPCDLFIAATTILAERTDMGVAWAYPYYDGSIGVVVHSDPQTSSGWAWTKPYTWNLWLALGLTALALPTIVYVLGAYSLRSSVRTEQVAAGYFDMLGKTLWIMLGKMALLQSCAAHTIFIVLAFSAVILVSSYTANLTAYLTVRKLSRLDSIQDLHGLAVSTVEAYQQRLQTNYGLKTFRTQVRSIDDVRREAGYVANGQLSAFLIDREAAEFVVATWPNCSLTVLPTTLEPFDYGLAFNSRIDRRIVENFNKAIIKKSEDGTISALADTFLLRDSPCLHGMDTDEEGQITFSDVYGLWILVTCAVFVAVVTVVALRVHRSRSKQTPARLPTVSSAHLENLPSQALSDSDQKD